jgi:hypothetical protein
MKDTVVFTFGRFNPPTTGHEKLIEKLASVAKKEGADFMVFPSHSQNDKKDPLDHKTKVGFMKKMFPKYSRNIISNKNAKTAFLIAPMLYDMGYKRCIMVVGGDRVTEFKTTLNKYNGKKGNHGFYDFKDGIEVVSAGERDPDAEGVSGMSASKMRAAAAANRYEDEKDPKTGKILNGFKSGLPKKFEKTTGKKLFDVLRKSMNISEELATFLDSVNGDLLEFLETDFVEYVDDADDNELYDSVYEEFFAERKVAQDKDIEDRKGTQPKKYYAKDADGDEMSKSTKQARARHFSKKKSGPAPGDANAKTKESEHTKKYRQMYGEAFDKPYAIKWEYLKPKGPSSAIAKLDDGSALDIHISEDPDGIYEIEFARGSSKKNMSRTGQGDEFRIFATVQAAMLKWWSQLDKTSARKITFYANKEDGNRSRLYKRFLKMWGTKSKWDIEVNGNAKPGLVAYTLTNPTPEKSKNSKKTFMQKLFRKEEVIEEGNQMGLIGLKQIKAFEKVVDQLFKKFDIDFNFTRHFGDRMDDDRNNPNITMKELADFIKKVYAKKGKSIKGMAGAEAVLKDIQTDINIPIAITYDRTNDEFDVVMKTIMRKKNFKTPDKVIKYEERDYKKEREQYHGTPEQMEKNRARKRARYAMEKAGKAKRGDGKDVHHKDNNPLNNDPKNLSLVSQHYNRKEPRMRKESPDYIEEISNMRRMKLVNKIKNSGVVKKGSMSKDDKKKDKQEGAGHSAAQRAAIAISKKEKAGKPGYDSEGKSLKKEADGCWNGYKQVGMKEKNGKMVPNCVPESVAEALASNQELMNKAALDALHKVIKSKGNKSSLKSYAFDIAKSFRGMKGRDLENLYKKSINANYKEETDLEEKKIDGLVKKADKSGISYGILKKVYDRGMAAWKTGHRPGTTPQQWAFARVNSFLTGGGARKADNDLWQKRK